MGLVVQPNGRPHQHTSATADSGQTYVQFPGFYCNESQNKKHFAQYQDKCLEL